MQQLTFRRNLDVQIVPNPRDALIEFYTSPDRNWSALPQGDSAFHLQLIRGNWAERRRLPWLPGAWIAKFTKSRQPLPPTKSDFKIIIESCPAELELIIQPKDGRLELKLTYVVLLLGQKPVSGQLKQKWKAAVDDDLVELEEFLS